MITVLVADDQSIVRTGLRLILESEADIHVVAEAEDGRAAVAAATRHRPDVVLMDLHMPVMDGVEALGALPTGIRALVLTTFSEETLLYASLRAGASGYLLKTSPPQQLVDAVRTVAAGDAVLDPRITQRLIDDIIAHPGPDSRDALVGLTERETELLTLIARGSSNRDIANELHLSEATVKTYLSRILTKTNRRDRAQLVALAYEAGLVRPGRS